MWISCGKRALWTDSRKSYRHIFNLEFLSNNLYLRLVWVIDLSKLNIFILIYFCMARTKLRAPCASDCSFTELRSSSSFSPSFDFKQCVYACVSV